MKVHPLTLAALRRALAAGLRPLCNEPAPLPQATGHAICQAVTAGLRPLNCKAAPPQAEDAAP